MKRDLDIDAFYGALESKKSELSVCWRGLAAELELPDHTVFTRMSRGQTPDVDTLLSLSAWLGVPLETYAHGEVAAPDSRPQTLESIRSYQRADEALSEESAEAITSVLRAAYDQLAQRQEIVAAELTPIGRAPQNV
jgi:hypothetical protein